MPQARGEKLATFGLTEPGVGTDAANLATTARRDGDSYVLNGTKIWIIAGRHRRPLPGLRHARPRPGATGPSRRSSSSAAWPASPPARIEGKLGIWAGNTGELFFDNVRVPVENRVGEEGEGFTIAMSAIDQGRFTVATGAVGLAQACLDASRQVRPRAHRPSARRSASTSWSSR